jgi:hypothetical protein
VSRSLKAFIECSGIAARMKTEGSMSSLRAAEVATAACFGILCYS